MICCGPFLHFWLWRQPPRLLHQALSTVTRYNQICRVSLHAKVCCSWKTRQGYAYRPLHNLLARSMALQSNPVAVRWMQDDYLLLEIIPEVTLGSPYAASQCVRFSLRSNPVNTDHSASRRENGNKK